MKILGISAFYHDSAACLVDNGKILAAAEEERFTRKKHDASFPVNAVEYCLTSKGITIDDLDYIVFYEKTFLKLERIIETYLSFAPSGIISFLASLPVWIRKKIWILDIIREQTGFKGKILFTSHHESHAASAFFASPFKEAAILVIDAVGEKATTSWGLGKGNSITMYSEINFPNSLGMLYSAFTYFTGFKVNSGEYKLMGLAPFGKPTYKDKILSLIDIKQDGSFKVNMEYFSYCSGLKMVNKKFENLFDGPPRKPEGKITQRDMDIARSIQEVTEEIILRIAKHIHSQTGQENLCLAGGVALNCVANSRLLKESPFKNIWVQPASGDSGGALGAALFVWYQYLGNAREVDGKRDLQQGSYLGPAFSNDQIKQYCEDHKIPFTKLNQNEIPGKIADLINAQEVIGLFQGRMEFGPRALGNRSIIGDARSPKMQKIMNLKIKFRESFRPFAPSVLYEEANTYFDIDCESPYMLFTALVKKEWRIIYEGKEKDYQYLERSNVPHSVIPAITHIDYSARIQTVKKEDNPFYYSLIEAFNAKYGCPVIINTSFNVRGEPIVCSPHDAYTCFMRTNMDYLLMGDFLLDKKFQPAAVKDDSWMKTFSLD